ncbi:MAG TPA: sigma-70 family RNA polymerase sigma factor [Dehalococcoidia bacterium]
MRRRGASIGEIEALYRQHLPRFLRATAAIVGDEGLASDAVQDAFASAVKARSSFRRDVALEAWLWRIVINAALQVRRGLRDEAESGAEVSVEMNGQLVEDLAVRRWVALLPERQRLAVFLRYFADHLDYRSIAVALDVEVGTVSATLSAAHAALRHSAQEVEL